MIPVFDMSRRIARFRDSIDRVTADVLDSGSLILGEQVSTFENKFARYLGVKECVSVANGTDALEIAMRSVGVVEGSLVVGTANAGNYLRTAANIIGAEVVYADVDKNTRNLTLESLLPHLKAGAQFVVATHLYGLAVSEIIQISSLCDEYNAVLIEDCAQANGAEINGIKVGNFGKAACFSFYPTKNLGALGDGGAVVTNDQMIADRVRALRTYGWSEKYSVALPNGRNSRLDELQAGYLSLFLDFLDEDNSRRRAIADFYNAASLNTSLVTPKYLGSDYVAHLYVVTVSNRDDAVKYFLDKGIATAIHYPIADYNQPYLSLNKESVQLKVTNELTRSVLTLPCFPEMKDSEVELVSTAIANYST